MKKKTNGKGVNDSGKTQEKQPWVALACQLNKNSLNLAPQHATVAFFIMSDPSYHAQNPRHIQKVNLTTEEDEVIGINSKAKTL